MSDVLQNLSICTLCIHRQKPGTLCTKTGQPFHEHADDSDCPEGFFDGQRLPVHRIIQGVVGIAKTVTGVDAATPEVIAERTAICKACPQAEVKDGALVTCRICKCSLWAKLTLNGEACPQRRWPAVAGKEVVE